MNLNIILLAAGAGTRMKSPLPKVLHCLGGKPLLQHVIETAQTLTPMRIYVVYGAQGEKIQSYFEPLPVELNWVEQKEQRGTAHAVMQVLPFLHNPDEKVLILYGDVPLISLRTLQKLIQITSKDTLGLVTAALENPFGFGRIVRNAEGKVIKIIEEKEASEEVQKIKEVNSGIYMTSVKHLQNCLPHITSHNAQKEFYLTDIVNAEGDIATVTVEDPYEIYGINDLEQLHILENYYYKKRATALRLSGVRIDANVILEGNIEIGAGTHIGANSILKNVKIGSNVEIKPNSIIEDSLIGDTCKIGPFARIRPGTVLASEVSVGNFVEIKNSNIHQKSKIPHLSYVGDTAMGKNVNIGAGVITCNYDGINKHRTIIEDDVFIGSDVQLIAPVTIKKGAWIGAGSTITKDAPADKLTLSRAKQQTIAHWIIKKKMEK